VYARILVLNAGSSSVKFSLYDPAADGLLLKGSIDRLGLPGTLLLLQRFYAAPDGLGETLEETPTHLKDVRHALPYILDLLLKERALRSLKDVAGIGHRVVHGAEKYTAATIITPAVLADIESLSAIAPLHNPYNLQGIRRCQELLPRVPNVAVFDTAFHQTIEPKTFLYGLPAEYYEKHGIRKYGFHGTNHKYCSLRAAEILGRMPSRLVTCHLGNGSSITAIKDGKSVDTSMGFTPTQGLIMGTRAGVLDPEVVLWLAKHFRSIERTEEFLNKECGLKAIAGTSDMREIWKAVNEGDGRAKLALEMLTARIIHYVGAYAATLGGLDCLVFSGGMGENAWYLREEVCASLRHLGVKLDEEKNLENAEIISAPDSKVKVLVLKANEELQIGREAKALLHL
jgi:acetate kinase